MKVDKKTIGIVVGAIILLIVALVAIIFIVKRDNDSGKGLGSLEDNLRFKEEYESYNGKKTEDDKDYLEVNVDENNPIVYKTDEEILDVLENETAIVYFGWPTCPWCRNIVEPLLQIAKDNHIEKIYYVNIHDIRDTYTVEKGKLKQMQKGTDAYYKILDFFGENLDAYYITDEDGKEYATGVSRMYAPTVAAVSEGKIKAIHEGTVGTQKDPYQGLKEDERKQLLAIYQNLYEPINKNVCSGTGC